MRALALLAVLASMTGCPRSPAPVRPAAGWIDAALTLPPGPRTGDALAELDRRADDDVHAAWQRAHYLLDLFDHARFTGDADSRDLLLAATDSNPAQPRGAAATDAALAALSAAIDRVLAGDRLHRGGAAARTLLRFDSEPPTRGQVLRRIMELKAARAVDSVSGNATLRLAGYCLRALDDATRGPLRRRANALAHCLYPLYDADPAPYFASPRARPPLPDWRVLRDAADRLLAAAAEDADRLQPTLEQLRRRLTEQTRAAADQLPLEPDPDALQLPLADHADPYDWTPMVPATGDLDAIANALIGPLEGDGRSVAAIALAADATPADLERALTGARESGAIAVDLLVGISQTFEVPEGDYAARAGASGTVRRAGAIRVALAPRASGDDTPTLGASAPLWDDDRARLGLHLSVGATSWRLVAASGELAVIDHAKDHGDPRTELRVALQRVQRAFADEAGLALVIAGDAPYRAVVDAATAAARDRRGLPLFGQLAIAEAAPKPTSAVLERRVARRWSARVVVDPPALGSSVGPLRSCYQDLLEGQPNLTARLRLESGASEVTGDGPTALRDCARRVLTPLLDGTEQRSIAVELYPR